ncbi:KpsF/GutQ family sugar-phosphate isomerase [Portibacter marinus]|uniref:KpsF/GutQ family sugar-phosphate isomerase n=1 Tax=Portibacter marinus TaxID=2898660 RepID=UPI001F3FBECC|nr:KpsF/GutQ family sugar-phosphate isomerase [Portibacter marinus]
MKEDIISIARKTIDEEANTLQQLSKSLDHHFTEIVEILYQCKGRIILTGIGKSALVAQKIVATLNSTGSPSIYMHAGDAAHGDLGMVMRDDVLVCFSKSGQTAELKVIIPLVKAQGTKVIGICSEKKCYLTENCDHHLIIPIDQEAAPNNLIPTSSTTAQAAIGDAIAVCLLSLRGFSDREYANFHPGGSIGKQLFLKVEDIYKQHEKPNIGPNATIRETILEMTSKRLGATVISENNQILGIITDGDLRRMLQSEKNLSELTAKDVMTRNPITIEHGELAYQAYTIMREKSISHIIVSDENQYKGILHLHDFVKEGF